LGRKTILVLYYTRGVYPLRNTIETHLYAFRRYSRHRTIYINIALGFPWEYVRSMAIDAIIFHTSFCGMRWSRPVFFKFTAMIREMADYPALKIAMPQDEFIHTDLLSKIIEDLKVDVVLSCAEESEWPVIYAKVDRKRVTFKTVLTGYLDEETVRKIEKFHKPLAARSHYITYRAWRAAFWIGEHGTHKVRIGEVFEKAAKARGVRTDISLNDGDTIAGLDWFRFLADSRAVIGVEGGASIIDPDGVLKQRVEDYVERNPDADFETVRDACFKDHEGSLNLKALSPRHLEAAAAKTCQVLMDGHYNGVLTADRHYIPVRSDYSNLDEVFEKLANDGLVQNLIDQSYEDLIQRSDLTYEGFVKGIEDEFISPLRDKNAPFKDIFKRIILNWRDWINWRIIQAELEYSKDPGRYRIFARFLRPLYRLFVQPL